MSWSQNGHHHREQDAVILGLASREAKPLALGFGGSFLKPSSKVHALANSFIDFSKTYPPFREILAQDGTTLEFIDDFVQTWDECNDFLYDFESLQRGAAWTKRQPLVPGPSHRLARYVYSREDFGRLERRLELQLYIMYAKMDDIVLNAFLDVVHLLGVMPVGAPAQPSIGLQWLKDEDNNILVLYELLVLLGNRLKRTPYTLSQARVNNVSQNLNPDDIAHFWQLLKARFKRHKLNSKAELPQFHEGQDEESLRKLSEDKLKTLQKTYWSFRNEYPTPTTRKRAYLKDDNYDSESSSFSPAMSFGSEIIIDNRDDPRTVYSMDIVNYGGSMLIVTCLDHDRSWSIIHYLPPARDIYPFTFHDSFSNLRPHTEVSLIEQCTVTEVSGSHITSRHEYTRPRYNFSSISDTSTLQSALRERYLQKTFQVEKISSKRGDENIPLVLKLWTDNIGENGSITFSRNKTGSGDSPHTEFLITDFAFPFSTKEHDQRSIRMTFNRKTNASVAPRKEKSASPPPASPGIIRRASSFVKRRLSIGSSSSALDVSVFPDASPLDNFYSPSSFKIGSESNVSTVGTAGTPRVTVNRDAKSFDYLEIEFSSPDDMRLFRSNCRKVHARSKELNTSPSLRYTRYSSDSTSMTSIVGRLPLLPPPPVEEEVSGRLDIVFRIRGIPQDKSEDSTKELLKQKDALDLDAGTEIDVRSLVTSEWQGQQVAIVGFNPVPLVLLNGKHEWSRTLKLEGSKLTQITIDDHFHGLTILYAPKPSTHTFDICAVSGLGGHALGSFKQRGVSWNWILNLLPEKFPGARIMTYGFDTKLQDSSSTQGLSSLGDELRLSLQGLNADFDTGKADEDIASSGLDESDRIIPLIFIAHSLGGLIVREAVIGAIDSATDNPSRTHKFLDSVHGAMFFGVPNQGMQTGAFHSVVKDRPNKSLVTNLEKDSDYLTKQSKHFNKAIENHCLDMLYFYEEKLSPQLAFDERDGQWKANGEEIFMVDKSSATNGNYSKEYEVTFRCNRNHSDLVKFGRHDEELKTVLRELKEVVQRAMKRVKGEEFVTPMCEGLRALPRVGTGLEGPSRMGTGLER